MSLFTSTKTVVITFLLVVELARFFSCNITSLLSPVKNQYKVSLLSSAIAATQVGFSGIKFPDA